MHEHREIARLLEHQGGYAMIRYAGGLDASEARRCHTLRRLVAQNTLLDPELVYPDISAELWVERRDHLFSLSNHDLAQIGEVRLAEHVILGRWWWLQVGRQRSEHLCLRLDV